MIHFFLLDRESTLFVVLHLMNFTAWSHEVIEFVKTTRGCLMEKLALIPRTTKLIVEDFLEADTNIPPETLALRFSWGDKKALAIIQDLLNKRWMTLDLLSILQEAQRTLPINANFISKNEFYLDNSQFYRYTFHIYENLSCLPRLCKDQQSQRQVIYK